jgi:transposase
MRKVIPASEPALLACASSHYAGRERLAMGHDVRLIPPIYVKPYVTRKDDAADASAVEPRPCRGKAVRFRPRARSNKRR